MPLYDYRCLDCEHTFEKQVKLANADEKQECPKCAAMNSEKFIGGAPGLTDSFSLGRIKPPEEFRNKLQEIHKKTFGSKLNETCRWV